MLKNNTLKVKKIKKLHIQITGQDAWFRVYHGSIFWVKGSLPTIPQCNTGLSSYATKQSVRKFFIT